MAELPLELERAAPVPAALAPESLTEVATMVPLELVSPRMTTESPGCRAERLTPRLLEILVEEESRTLTTFPVGRTDPSAPKLGISLEIDQRIVRTATGTHAGEPGT